MNKLKWIVIIFIISINLNSLIASNSDKLFYKRYEGTVGNLQAIMNLTINGEKVTGNYYYKNHGIPIDFNFDCTFTNGVITLVEYSQDRAYDNSEITGKFELKFDKDSSLTGMWSNPKTGKKLECSFFEKYPENSVKIILKKMEKHQGENSDTEAHAFAKIIYPDLSSIDAKIRSKILNKLADALGFKDFQDENLEYVLQSSLVKFINDYNNENAELIADTSVPAYMKSWESEQDINMYFNSDNILTFEIFNYRFSGGAHGNYNIGYVSFDLSTGNEISWSDLIPEENRDTLDETGKQILWKRFKIKKDKEQEEQFWFEYNKFKLNDNCAVTSGGLKFLFNPYEVAAYAVGQIEIFIPFKDVKSVLKNNSLTERIIK